MTKKIIIGSRGSKLALIYAQNAKNKIVQNTSLNNEDVIIKEIKFHTLYENCNALLVILSV